MKLPPSRWNWVLAVAGVVVAIALRGWLFPFESGDYLVHKGRWYAFIDEHGFVAALQRGVSNYNVAYLYLLGLTEAVADFLPWLHPLYAIKSANTAFDFVLAWFVCRCVALRARDSTGVPVLAGIATLLAPTVVLNGAAWTQADAIYTAGLVACLYYLLAGRHTGAAVAFGLALSVKLQAIFLAPLLLWLLAKDQLHWRFLAVVALVYLAMLVPAWLAGASLDDLLQIYFRQLYVYDDLSREMPNLYAWIPDSYYPWWPVGVIFSAGVVLIASVAVYRSSAKIDADAMVFLATYALLLVPYTLPKMHDRFFYPADVVAIVLAFFLPRFWYVPLVVGAVSLHQYAYYLLEVRVVPIEWLALTPLALLAVLSWQLPRRLAARAS